MRFVCDAMLGKLAVYLRMVGIDTAYSRGRSLPPLIAKAQAEGRIILTRRTEMSRKASSVGLYFVKSNYPAEQLRDVITHFALSLDQKNFFSRCLLCNERLVSIDKIAAQGNVPEYVLNTSAEFSQCPCCKKIYWKGTHYSHMLRHFNNLLNSAGGDVNTVSE